MISPLLPGQIKGVIWYQGESNADRAMQYQTLLPTLVNDWRARFGAETGAPMPFYIVQLANFQAQTDDPNNGGWAYLREAQSLTAKNVPDTGIAVITDIGEAGDIHPKNKQDVGLRLALAALHQTYGENIEYSGPTLKNAQVRGRRNRFIVRSRRWFDAQRRGESRLRRRGRRRQILLGHSNDSRQHNLPVDTRRGCSLNRALWVLG